MWKQHSKKLTCLPQQLCKGPWKPLSCIDVSSLPDIDTPTDTHYPLTTVPHQSLHFTLFPRYTITVFTFLLTGVSSSVGGTWDESPDYSHRPLGIGKHAPQSTRETIRSLSDLKRAQAPELLYSSMAAGCHVWLSSYHLCQLSLRDGFFSVFLSEHCKLSVASLEIRSKLSTKSLLRSCSRGRLRFLKPLRLFRVGAWEWRGQFFKIYNP